MEALVSNLPAERIEVIVENTSVIYGAPVQRKVWRFRLFEALGDGGSCQSNIAECYSVAEAAAECEHWLDHGVPVYPAAGGWL